jgi:integrase
MVKLQILTGMRPHEVVEVCGQDLNTKAKVWEYRPARHKNQHRGQGRVVDAEAWRHQQQHAERKTPANQGNRPGYSKRVREGQRKRREPGAKYTPDSYRRAIDYACAKAFPHPGLAGVENLSAKQQAELKAWRRAHRFHPHQGRHTAATRIAKTFRLEVAQAVLGHASRSTTERYAELASDLARDAMGQAG